MKPAQRAAKKTASAEDYQPVPFVTDFQWLEKEERRPSASELALIAAALLEHEHEIAAPLSRPWEFDARLRGLRKG